MKNFFALTTLLLLSSSINAKAATCPSESLCPTLKAQTVNCKKWYSEKTCDKFVETYEKLVDRYDCKRSADTKPVPAIWLCDVGETDSPKSNEKAVMLLYKLKFPKARTFFASKEFRSTLDGDMVESFTKKSLHAAEAEKK